MNSIAFPGKAQWASLLARPVKPLLQIEATVAPILSQVRIGGDTALIELTKQFDQVDLTLTGLEVSQPEIDAAEDQLSTELKSAIRQAYQNIRLFHERQKQPVETIETMPGVFCWRKSVGIQKVGLYIPGGTAPISVRC